MKNPPGLKQKNMTTTRADTSRTNHTDHSQRTNVVRLDDTLRNDTHKHRQLPSPRSERESLADTVVSSSLKKKFNNIRLPLVLANKSVYILSSLDVFVNPKNFPTSLNEKLRIRNNFMFLNSLCQHFWPSTERLRFSLYI